MLLVGGVLFGGVGHALGSFQLARVLLHKYYLLHIVKEGCGSGPENAVVGRTLARVCGGGSGGAGGPGGRVGHAFN